MKQTTSINFFNNPYFLSLLLWHFYHTLCAISDIHASLENKSGSIDFTSFSISETPRCDRLKFYRQYDIQPCEEKEDREKKNNSH